MQVSRMFSDTTVDTTCNIGVTNTNDVNQMLESYHDDKLASNFVLWSFPRTILMRLTFNWQITDYWQCLLIFVLLPSFSLWRLSGIQHQLCRNFKQELNRIPSLALFLPFLDSLCHELFLVLFVFLCSFFFCDFLFLSFTCRKQTILSEWVETHWRHSSPWDLATGKDGQVKGMKRIRSECREAKEWLGEGLIVCSGGSIVRQTSRTGPVVYGIISNVEIYIWVCGGSALVLKNMVRQREGKS